MKTAIILLSSAAALIGAPLQSAKITQAVKDVKVYTSSSSPRAANVGETIRGKNSVATGRKSRAELQFGDNTITRLGQNSVFRFRDGSRDVELERGSVLLQVPKSAGGATIRTATVTAAITGTTSMFEYSPGEWVKLLTLEGTQKLYIKGQKDPVSVPAGQMIIMHPDGRVIPKPVTIDLAKLVSTSVLAGDKVFGTLPQASRQAIAQTIQGQRQLKRNGALLPTNQVVSGPGTRGGKAVRDIRQPNPGSIYDPNHSRPGDTGTTDPPFTDPPFTGSP